MNDPVRGPDAASRGLLRLGLVLGLAGLAAGCASTQTFIAVPPTASPGQEVTLWSGGNGERLHGVRVHGDSVSGIPLAQPLSCGSCRRGYRVADIDSVTVRRTDQTAIFLAALPFAALISAGLLRLGGRD